MIHVDDERVMRAAVIIRDAAERACQAADRMETAAQRMAMLLEDGYGGNGLRLIEALERAETKGETR